MIPPIDEIRKNYSKLPDQKLLELATKEARSLRPEALTVLKEEIYSRGLSENLDASIDVQMKGPDPGDLSEMVERIRKLNCPICQEHNSPVNAIETYSAARYLVAVIRLKHIVAGCADCLTNKNNNSLRWALLLGWWALPFWLIRTPGVIMLYFANRKKIISETPSDAMVQLVKDHAGAITKCGNDTEQLNKWIVGINP